MTIAPLRLAAHAPLVARLAPRIPEIALEVRDVCVSAMPIQVSATEGYFADDVRPAIYACCSGYLRALEESRTISREEIARIVMPVAERHAPGNRIGLSLLMSALHSGAGHLWSLIAESAEPSDAADLAAFTEHLFAFIGEVSAVLAETYIDSEQSAYSGDPLARRALCAALLKGDPAEELAIRADITLVDRYDVVALQIRSEEGISGPGAMLGARHRLRLAQQAFDHFAGGPVLNTFDGISGVVLLAAETVDVDQSGDAIEQLIATLERQFHIDTHAAVCRDIVRAEIPASGDTCRQVAEIAQLLGRPSGLYRPDDFLLEQQITRPGPARERIAALLIPLREHPHLLETLEMHVQYGGADRKTAADKMFIHPNTFSYRLRRVAELTGVDPLQPNGFRLHAAAMIIHRIDRAKSRICAEAPGTS
ncbi:PucR family transcriptional regulator [Nocardia sp. NPDC056000]|uniref:PucR family transcriptional regulator n=1 Tax=Nocardia sp. NPDC056000 TaxID=3345674 RepID=UPI0035DDC671